MKVRFSHLPLSERRKIERWRQTKLSRDEMARRLGRHRSTIFRELRRNHSMTARSRSSAATGASWRKATRMDGRPGNASWRGIYFSKEVIF